MGPCQILTLGLTGAALKLPGCFWEPSGKLLGSLRMLLRASGGLSTVLGASWELSGSFWELLGASGSFLGAFWEPLGAFIQFTV